MDIFEAKEAINLEGGTAFPFKVSDLGHTEVWSGMTLRDWFAGQAIISIAARGEATSRDQARKAYEISDAMLAARAK